MGLLDDFYRVDEAEPCPICGSTKWCLIAYNRRKVLCQRNRSWKKHGKAGYVHYISDEMLTMAPPPKQKRSYKSSKAVERFYRKQHDDVDLICTQASLLGLTGRSLVYMRSLYCREKAALVIPMFNSNLNMCGLQFRRSDGKRWSLKGGRLGMFMSVTFNPKEIIGITEGATDAAALCASGFTNVLGRPSCSGGELVTRAILRDSPRTPIVMFADPDECGQEGARGLAASLPNPIVILTPKNEDADTRKVLCGHGLSFQCILDGVMGSARSAWNLQFMNESKFYPFVERLKR